MRQAELVTATTTTKTSKRWRKAGRAPSRNRVESLSKLWRDAGTRHERKEDTQGLDDSSRRGGWRRQIEIQFLCIVDSSRRESREGKRKFKLMGRRREMGKRIGISLNSLLAGILPFFGPRNEHKATNTCANSRICFKVGPLLRSPKNPNRPQSAFINPSPLYLHAFLAGLSICTAAFHSFLASYVIWELEISEISSKEMPKNSVKWRTEEQRSRIKQRDQLGQAQHLQPQPASEFPRGRALQLQLKSLSSSLHCSPCLSLSLSHSFVLPVSCRPP